MKVPGGHFGSTLGSLWVCLWVILKVLSGHFGSTLGLLERYFQGNFGVRQGVTLRYPEILLMVPIGSIANLLSPSQMLTQVGAIDSIWVIIGFPLLSRGLTFFCVRPWSDTYRSACLYLSLSLSETELFKSDFTTVFLVTGWFLWDISSFPEPYSSELKFWGYTEVTWGVTWDDFGGTQGSFFGYSGVTLRALWDHFGFTFGTTLVVVWGHFEGTQ